MVETGRAAAFVMDDVLLASLAASSKEPGAYAISSEALSKPEPYGIMLRKDDAPFKAVVDEATAKLYKSPEGQGPVRHLVHQADPATRHQPQPAHERADDQGLRVAERQRRPGRLLSRCTGADDRR